MNKPAFRSVPIPKIGFYADDFTGAVENMAQYDRHGLKTILFVNVPDQDKFDAACKKYDVVGIAGISRSLQPDAMRVELRKAFNLFGADGFDVIQYKVCSTFDSSPEVGNLGVVLDEAKLAFPNAISAMMIAAPDFGRYTLFGQHFANLNGVVHRLDRHPSLSQHPITPMREADLALHFNLQRPTRSTLISLLALHSPFPELVAQLKKIVSSDTELVLFDTFDNEDLATGVKALVEVAEGRPVFSISSQGFAVGTGMVYGQTNTESRRKTCAPRSSPLVVLSGSGSIPSAAQTSDALSRGWASIRLDTTVALDGEAWNVAVEDAGNALIHALNSGRSTIVFTALGPDDETMLKTQATLRGTGLSVADLAPKIGNAFAELAKRAATQASVKRIVIAGGDTSSYAMRSINADAIEARWLNFSLGAHICRLLSADSIWSDCEIVLKGGQGGPADLYSRLEAGSDWA